LDWYPIFALQKSHLIGNCNDPASLDSVKWVINEIWPIILKSMPDAKLDLYGQNFPQEIQEIQSDSIRCMGETDDWRILSRYRVTLAPFRFGAGIKKYFFTLNNYS